MGLLKVDAQPDQEVKGVAVAYRIAQFNRRQGQLLPRFV